MAKTVRPLTVVSLEKLSDSIAAAVSEVAGEQYTAAITQIDFESGTNDWMNDETVITLRLRTVDSSWWCRQSHAEDGSSPTEE